MNLVYRYLDQQEFVLLFNKSNDMRYIMGQYLKPNEAIRVSSGVAQTVMGMMSGGWLQAVRFSEVRDLQRRVEENHLIKEAKANGYIRATDV